MSKISKIPYQKKVFSPIRICIFVLKSLSFADLIMFFSENYSAVHLINSGTFIDLLSLFLKEKIDFGLFL